MKKRSCEQRTTLFTYPTLMMDAMLTILSTKYIGLLFISHDLYSGLHITLLIPLPERHYYDQISIGGFDVHSLNSQSVASSMLLNRSIGWTIRRCYSLRNS